MANESAIRAGKAFIELFADDSKLVRGMQAAEAKLKAFGNNVASIGKKMMLGGMGIVGSLFGASKVYADVGSRIKDMSDRTGMGAVAVQELAYAAEQSGADMATLETGVRKMQRAIVEAGQGAAGPTDALATLGLTAAELAGKSPDQQLALIGARLTAIEDPGEKAAAAMELFGKSGTSLLPMLADMGELQAEFRKKGLGMSAEDVAAAEAYGDTLSALGKSFQQVVAAVGGAVAPMLKSFAESVAANAGAVREWVHENGALLGQILKYGALLLAGGAAMTAFGKAIGGVATAIGIARQAMTFFAAHPAIAALMVVGAAAAGIAAAANARGNAPLRAASAQSSEGAAAIEAGQKQRTTDLEHLDRLGQLAEAEKLNNAESAEAAAIIEVLTERYGDLGIKIDEATGKITGFSEGQKKAKAHMFAAALAEVDAQIANKKAEGHAAIQAARVAEVNRDYTFGLVGDVEGNRAKSRAAYGEAAALEARRKAILAGQEEALKAEAAAKESLAAKTLKGQSEAARKAAEKEAQERQRVADGNERLMMELHGLKLQQIADQYERERAEINATYDEKRRAAEKAGLDIELVEMARRERLKQQDIKATEEADAWADQLAEERRKTAGDLQDEIDRLKIDTNANLSPAEKARQQMELRHAKELRQLGEVDAGDANSFAAMREKHALEAKQLLMAQDVPKTLRQSVAGTFNATVVGRMGSGNYAERTARATEKTAKNTEELLKKPAAALAFG